MSRLLPPRFLLPVRRFFTTTSRTFAFATGPSPPRLPPKEQEEWDRLQKASTGAFSTPRTINQSPASKDPAIDAVPVKSHPKIDQSPQSSTPPNGASQSAEEIEIAAVNARVQATGKGEELHPDVRRGAKPEFEGDVNPKTGEIGGPKNEPLRWGSTGEQGDWSYNGRVTDF